MLVKDHRDTSLPPAATDTCHAIFDAVDQGFCLIEVLLNNYGQPIDLVCLEANPVFLQQIGLTNIIGKRMRAIMPGVDQQWIDFYGQVALTGKAARQEYQVDKTGEWFTSFATHVGGTNSLQVAIVFDNITDRKRQEQHQALLASISKDLVVLDNPAGAMEKLGEKIGRHFDAQWCAFTEYDSDWQTCTTAGWHRAGHTLFDLYYTGNYLTKEQAARNNAGEWTIIGDTETDPRTQSGHYSTLGIAAFILIPLARGGQWQFQMVVSSNTARTWRQDEIDIAHEVTTRIWARIERARTEQALRKSEARLSILKEAYQSVVGGAPLEDSLNILTRLVSRATNEQARIGFYIANPEGTLLRSVPGTGSMGPHFIEKVDRFPIGTDSLACGLAVPTGRPVLTEDVWQEPRWRPWLFLAEEFDYRACWSFPITTREKVPVGTLALYFRCPRRPTLEDLSLAETLTQAAAVIISHHSIEQQRELAYQELRDNEQQLRQLVKLRDDFIGVASHELKTPITSMKAYAEIVQANLEETGDTVNSELVKRVDAQITRLTALINHLLDTTRFSEEKLQLVFETFDINELLQERIEDIQYSSRHRFQLHTAASPSVMADRQRIGQVITNLLSNAVKYAPGGSLISVSSRSTGEGVEVAVADQGPGIAEEHQHKIFERFYRVTANHMDTFPGMGLGLYISDQIVRRHGGAMNLQSKPGQGATFSFTIPYPHTA